MSLNLLAFEPPATDVRRAAIGPLDSLSPVLRASLEPLTAGQSPGQPPVLFGGIEPYPDNWRASVRRPATLPHFPMVLHRGGYPDGS